MWSPDTGNELFWKIFSGLPQAENGQLTMNSAPGLGIVPRNEVIARLCA